MYARRKNVTLAAVNQICQHEFHALAVDVHRNLPGIGSCVYTASYPSEKYVIKISPQKEMVGGSAYWLNQLKDLDLPIPEIVALNSGHSPAYCIRKILEGEDLGLVYKTLTNQQKKDIAQQIFSYQNIIQRIPQAKGFGYLHTYEDSENMKSSWNEVVCGKRFHHPVLNE
jgi:hypothetical protein